MVRKAVLITGGSRGIGYAIARGFAAQGDAVTITGRDATTLAKAAEAIGARALVADADDATALQALGAFPHGLDVLVNNAGGFATPPPPVDAGLSELGEYWMAGLRRNLLGAVLTTAAVEPIIIAGGSIISVGSIGGEYASNPYSVAKAAISAWNVGLSERVGPRGITANVIAPGYVEGTSLFGGPLPKERLADLIGRTHVKRAATTADIAATALFLASDGARHLTGQVIHVNGGAHTTR